MPDLFGDAFSGRQLDVSRETDAFLAECFPEVDRHSCYREADAWLWTAPARRRPRTQRGVRQFLRTWMVKEKRAVIREQRRGDAVKREAQVGRGPLG